jgi:hypothetical protein
MTAEQRPDPNEELLKIKATRSFQQLVAYQAKQVLIRMDNLTTEANEMILRALKLTEEKTESK